MKQPSGYSDRTVPERAHLSEQRHTGHAGVVSGCVQELWRVVSDDTAPVPTKAALQDFVVKQREHGLRAVTVNTYIGALNAFCVWLHAEGHSAERVKLSKLRVEKRI